MSHSKSETAKRVIRHRIGLLAITLLGCLVAFGPCAHRNVDELFHNPHCPIYDRINDKSFKSGAIVIGGFAIFLIILGVMIARDNAALDSIEKAFRHD